MIGALQVVEREHTVFCLDVLEDDLPVVVVVELGRDDIVGEDEAFLNAVEGVAYRHVGTAYLVAIVQVSRKQQLALLPREAVVDILARTVEPSLCHILLEIHPHAIVRLLEEHCLIGNILRNLPFCIVMHQQHMLHALAPSVGRNQLLLAEDTYPLVPHPLELGTLHRQREVFVFDAQEFHCLSLIRKKGVS